MNTIPACPPTPCREWHGANVKGYGYKQFNGKRRLIHRWVYSRLHGGFRGIHGKIVMHLCDNPRCYRYDHLWLGTQQDNIADMDQKSRGRRAFTVRVNTCGEQRANHKLTERDVREIRQLRASGEWTLQQLADEFGVSNSHVHKIVTGNKWAHV